VGRYLPPSFRLSSDELTEGVTMAHLFTHVSGWVGDYFGDTGEGDDALERFVAKLAKAPQLTALGEVYSYSNSALNLASYVVATVQATSYERALRDLVLKPLGLRSTTLSTEEAITRRVAIGHRDGRPQPWRRPRAHHGAGGVLSTASDMLAFAAHHLDHGQAMFRPRREAGCFSDEIGLVWRVDVIGGDVVVHHGGTTNGYQADLRLVPERGLAWVLLTNAEHHHQLDHVLLRHFLGTDRADAAGDPFVPDSLQPYCGTYDAVLYEATVDIGDDGGLRATIATPERAVWLRGEAPPPPDVTRLAFRPGPAPDRVVALDPPFAGDRAEFLRGPGGEVEWFRWDGRIARYRK
jgi:CubicO group peptidase (beta-lactamase class C family)